ncbi:MAG: segregation/condensation protein A [Phycisphaerae bacterium]|nr:segregation/condensation protein A [Phycisphaerae bacterium]
MSSPDDYQVHLSSFQGPLDLLLYLIRRAEVAIEEIPIHEITEQYLSYLEQLGTDDLIDIDVAGEFLVMAATLVEIKSRTLAPKPEGEDGQPAAEPKEAVDPRQELVAQLLAYQRFRNAADELERLRAEYSAKWVARAHGSEVPERSDDAEMDVDLEDAHILDLFETYERIIGSIDLSRLGDHRVEYDDTPITLHQTDLLDRLQRSVTKKLSLRDAFDGRTRGEMIGLFLATLELARQRKILVKQDDVLGDIQIELNPEDDGVMAFESSEAKS